MTESTEDGGSPGGGTFAEFLLHFVWTARIVSGPVKPCSSSLFPEAPVHEILKGTWARMYPG